MKPAEFTVAFYPLQMSVTLCNTQFPQIRVLQHPFGELHMTEDAQKEKLEDMSAENGTLGK